MLSYETETRTFSIEFTHQRKQKLVQRLSVLFDDEDEGKFHERVERCHEARLKNLAIRRYTEFVDSQPATTFSPIRQSTLHGVVSKLMRNSDEVHLVHSQSHKTCSTRTPTLSLSLSW